MKVPLSQGRCKHDAMTVCSDETKFSHSPWLVANRLANIRARGDNGFVKRIDFIYLKVCEVRMVAEFRRWNCIRALASKDRTVARCIDQETWMRNSVNSKAEHISVESRRGS